MKNISTSKGLTLIELIIATVLIVVIVLGLFSVNAVLQNNNQDYGQRYLINSQTQITLNHILNNAALAVGSGTTDNFGVPDLGILIGTGNIAAGGIDPGVGDANSFCIHQAANNNIINASNDIWLCYSLSNNEINYCTMPFLASPTADRGAASCTTNNAAICTAEGQIPEGQAGSLCTGPTFLGTAYSITNVPANSSFPSSPYFTEVANNQVDQMAFSIAIENCLNNSAVSTCFSANPDPVNNPELAKTGTAFPLQHGMIETNN